MADDAPLAGMLSIDDAAAELDVSRSTVYRMIGDGKLAAIQHGKRSWIERTELADYIARARSAAAQRRIERAQVRAPQANRLAVLLDALDGVALSDDERASLTRQAGFEAATVANIAAVITRARRTQ